MKKGVIQGFRLNRRMIMMGKKSGLNTSDRKLILENWDLLSTETKSMLELVGITPRVENGEEAN